MAVNDPSLLFDRKQGIVIPGATEGNDTLSGSSKPETFYINGSSTGQDTIKGFGKNDILVVDAKIFDGNNDGIINFGKNGVLDLDGPDRGIDTITFDGDIPSEGLRYIGTDGQGHFAYADASVRLEGFTELKLGNQTVNATSKAENFFFDTALDVNWGNDQINKFGLTDRLVTTTEIFDGNKDGIIQFDKNGKLDLNGSAELGHAGQQNQESPFGKVGITDFTGKTVTALHFDHSDTVDGVTYYYYGLNAPVDFIA